MKLNNNKILITGGATGIGLGLAERFMKENNTVIICGRRESALKAAAAKLPGVITKQCDLSKQADREALLAWVQKEHSDLNVLANNAGIQNWMKITDADFYAKAKEEMTTNIDAPLHLTSLFLNLKSIHTVMNVTSGLAFSPLNTVAIYCATKAFLRSFTLSLRVMLKPRNIEVIEIIPPALNTDLGGQGVHTQFPPVSDFIESIFAQLKEGKNELTFGSSEPRSKAGQDVLMPIFKQMNQIV